MTMMTILPISTSNLLAPIIQSNDINYLDNYDPGTLEHWIFDRGNISSITGRKNGKVLTPQVAPVYNRSNLTISGALANAIISDYPDSSLAVDTFCMVFKCAAGTIGQSLILSNGTLSTTGLYISVAGGGVSRTANLSFSGVGYIPNIGAIAAGQYYFIAVARNFSGTTKIVRYIVGGMPAFESIFFNMAYSPNLISNVGLGNTSMSGTDPNSISYSEFRIYPRCLSLIELNAVYVDAKKRAALRGISVV